ncbi:MAG: tetratricopeptide repeat protein [candidate division Zixibacteria bacterium]|nr:tetratricopeptide repeat protein [candidate division Zixibacteria bacterium]
MRGLKHTFKILASFSVASVLVYGCSDHEGLRKRFNTEKLFYKAEKASEMLMLQPLQINSERMDSVIGLYEEVSDYVEENVNSAEGMEAAQMRRLAGMADLKIAELYSIDNRYADAYRAFKETSLEYSEDPRVSFNAALQSARTLEKLGDYRGAIGEYEGLFRQYPLTTFDARPVDEYISAPVRSAKLYLELGDKKAYREAMEDARDFLREGIEHFNKSAELVNRLKLEIAAAYSAEEKFEDAVMVLNSITDSVGVRPFEVRLRVASEYLNNIGDYNSAKEEFRDIMNDEPDSSTAARAQFGLAMSYYKSGDYGKARDEFTELEKRFPKAVGLHAKARWFFAKSFEEEQRWDRALVEFNYIVANYTESPEALEAPLYIAQHYQKTGDKGAARQAFREAVSEYRRIISRFGSSPISTQASANIAKAYIMQEKWQDAVDALLETARRYPNTTIGRDAMLTAADISEKNLRDREAAAEIYRDYIEAYPWISFKNQLETKIEQLER